MLSCMEFQQFYLISMSKLPYNYLALEYLCNNYKMSFIYFNKQQRSQACKNIPKEIERTLNLVLSGLFFFFSELLPILENNVSNSSDVCVICFPNAGCMCQPSFSPVSLPLILWVYIKPIQPLFQNVKNKEQC